MARPATVAPERIELSDRELVARVFRTLGEARRLSIVELLLERGEMSQSELFQELGIPQSRASEHLQCLVWCGFLLVERRGKRLHYRIADPRAKTLIHLAYQFLRENQAGIGTCRTLDALPD
jgi:DNA-binding transcriptional ArsR family regulator